MNGRYGSRQELDFGALLSLSFANLWLIRWQVLAYLGIFTALSLTLPLLGEGISSGGGIAVYLIAQHWLYQAFFKARGTLETQRNSMMAFILLAFALIVPIIAGIGAFVLPGLFLVARWIAAPAFVVARGRGVFAAAGDSWDTVRGNTFKVAGAVVVLSVIASLVSGIISAIASAFDGFAIYRGVNPIDLVGAHFMPLMLLGLSTATYELLGPEDTTIEDVFG